MLHSDICLCIRISVHKCSNLTATCLRCVQLAKYLQIEVMVTTGGTSLKDDIMRLYQTTHIVVATPGRVVDLAQKGVARLSDCRMLVMDEVGYRSTSTGNKLEMTGLGLSSACSTGQPHRQLAAVQAQTP